MNKSYSSTYNPDVLSTLANLSSDEVFTPPHIVNQMLDMLPQELFSDKTTTFLDPATKSGVFLREITKRLIKGLENEIPDLQERLDYILHNQVFGIAITELTALLSRRSLYCSKYPNSQYSLSVFNTLEGNILFGKSSHTWKMGKCIYCNASQSEYERSESVESYSYDFIHNFNIEEIRSMKFDVIIGNPPYQISDGGAQASATPIYHYFIETAKKLNPKYISMITPSRWFSGGKGLDQFREKNLIDKRYKKLVDFVNSEDCFPGVQIKGGVNYFLWDRDYNGDCEIKNIIGNNDSLEVRRPLKEDDIDVFIRYNRGLEILKKVMKNTDRSFESIVSSQKPFGLRTFVTPNSTKEEGDIVLYGNKSVGFYPKKNILKNKSAIDKYKVLISMAYGAGEGFPHQIINKPIIAAPGSACTETYLLVGPFNNLTEAENTKSYMETKFFRFLVMLRKITQHASKSVYRFVPLLDSSLIEVSDKILYEFYNLNSKEIDFIEMTVKEMIE
jgi:site-specific DNA-methyltransferase (adenine-specific)